ncbi:hypothetical protein PR202_gb21272 [Eleusine coracana subsp. coracana]|uniref:Bromo domain-containing protein n=1 Tax=Eleusine coracana subsp. coracana TaxID=191504 RepID=A0AAV5FD75_ELECO|nr:hypothetical protein PR202_gb21272 [Eleusine coracana subsp. coracana]
MVVVAVGGGAGAGAHGGWGTWEELVLGGAVLRHGGAAWAAVADELRTRSPCTFSPEDCEAKFAEIQSRYSACNFLSSCLHSTIGNACTSFCFGGTDFSAWFEELRKQRVAELKRELEKSDSSIGSLQSVIESLSNSKHGDGSSDCRTTHTESCSHSGNVASSSKELSRDRSSAGSFTEEASNSQKAQQMQRCDTDSIQTNNLSTEESFLKAVEIKVWGSRKQRGRRVRRILQTVDASSRDGEPTSAACIERDGSSEVCKEGMKKGLNLKAPNVEPGAAKKGLKTPNAEPDAMKNGFKTPNVKPGVMKKGLTTPCVVSGVMKKGLKTPKAESGVMKNGLKTPKLESGVKDGLKAPKLESGVMKDGLKTPNLEPGVMTNLKTPKVESGVSMVEREKANLTAIVKFISTQGDCLMLQRQVDVQRKRVTYKKMIRRHMDFRILHSKIKNGTISSTKELLRDMLLFVNNVIAFYPKATLEHMAAIELRDLACKILDPSANIDTETVKAPILKKNAQVAQPGRHGPDDAKGNKVPLRDATASARQGEGKGIASARQGEGKDSSSSDKPPAANLRSVPKSEPVKKRGVGRPRKSGGSLKRSAPAQEDSPRRTRIRRGP